MNETLLHLSLITGVGPGIVEKIARVLPYARFHELYSWSAQDIMYRARIADPTAQSIAEGLRDTALRDRELRLIQQHSVRWVTIDDASYPQALKNTHLPPVVLYWQGAALSVLERSVAVVGARKANLYGQRVIDAVVPEIVSADWAIVSGGALGADTMAHKAALRAGGVTAAVIGAGLLCPYPKSNERMFVAIAEQGGIVMSPFPLTMEAMPGNFPARNRIIAGLSRATVVVQAAEKSGALITAFFALEQGREVGAVPGHIDDPLSAGCHALLRDGAFLVRSAADVLAALGEEQQRVTVSAQSMVAEEQLQVPFKAVPSDPLVAACVCPQFFDDLSTRLGYDELHLRERLMTLQLEGVVEQDSMGRWYSIT